MTVCIAALCRNEGQPHAVVAADRMVTLGNFIEFEHAVPKMAISSPHAIAMVAGDTLTGVRLSQEVAGGMAGTNPPIVAIAQQLATHYEATRSARIEQQILAPRGLNWQTYYGGHAA